MKAEYPNQLDYRGSFSLFSLLIIFPRTSDSGTQDAKCTHALSVRTDCENTTDVLSALLMLHDAW